MVGIHRMTINVMVGMQQKLCFVPARSLDKVPALVMYIFLWYMLVVTEILMSATWTEIRLRQVSTIIIYLLISKLCAIIIIFLFQCKFTLYSKQPATYFR